MDPFYRGRRSADQLRVSVQILLHWGLLAGASLTAISILAPAQLPVIVYSLAKISLGALLGYWVDRTAFPQVRPEVAHLMRRYIDSLHREDDHVMLDTTLAMHSLRRAVVIGSAMLALCLTP